MESNIEFTKIENNLQFSKNNKLKIIKSNKKVNNPKISIISPIFNRERYILRFLKSIQLQKFKNIEIIFIDDYSLDNGVKLIEKYQKNDKRIVLIQNKKNKGTLISRNLGVIYSKGKYIILPDPDDILSKNILNICYKYSEKYKYEMIRFNMYIGNKRKTLDDIVNKLNRKPLYQPELFEYLFYGKNELEKIDFHICNKFIKRELYIRAINSLNNYYLNMYVIYRDDSIMNYNLYKNANSFFFLKNIGYYYVVNTLSVTSNLFKRSELRIKFAFIFIKVIFDLSKNTKLEKDMTNFLLTMLNRNFNVEQKLLFYNKDLNFYYDTITNFLNCKFITRDNKDILTVFKNIIEKKGIIHKNYKQ